MYEEVIQLQPQGWWTVKEAPKDWKEYVRKDWAWVINTWFWNLDWWYSDTIYLVEQVLDWWESENFT